MKLEVRCPSCRKGYLVDESARGGEFWCPACTTPIDLDLPQQPEPAAPAQPQSDLHVACPRCHEQFPVAGHTTEAAPVSRPRILIVDDHGYFRGVAEEVLAPVCEITCTADIQEALELLTTGRTDLLVLGISPDNGGQGRQLLGNVASMPRKPCPIVVYTERDEAEMVGDQWDELHRLGADDIVLKGMNAAESLLSTVGTLLGHGWAREEVTR